jgi:hypothetical protein
MSPIGKWLLLRVDENLHISKSELLDALFREQGFSHWEMDEIAWFAINMGVTIS